MELFILEYYQLFKFKFLGKVEEGIYLEGKFVRDDEYKQKMGKINELEEHEEEQGRIWYLDQEGYRLADKDLYINSPWSIIEDGIRKKAVRRFLMADGSAGFALDSWSRTGDE